MASGGFRPSYEAIYGTSERAQTSPLTPGTVIDNTYMLGKPLGKGGMGAVYQCTHTVMGKEYAIKLLEDDHSEPALWQRFQNEARAIARLNHPNIVAIHNMGIAKGIGPYYVMDLVEGQTLSRLIAERGRLPVEEALKIFSQVTYCLNFAHEQGIIHRDIKPANIMITPQGQVKLLDFGLAKFTNSGVGQGLTATGEIFGSPSYMSPEQGLGKPVDNRSDIYSTAVSLFESLTGRLPLFGRNAMQTMYKIQTEKAPSLRTACSGQDFSSGLEEIVAHGLEKDPQFRYQHMDEFGEDLRRVLQGKEPRYTSAVIRNTSTGTEPLFPIADSARNTVKLRADIQADQEDEEDEESADRGRRLIKLLILAVLTIGLIGTAVGMLILKPWTHGEKTEVKIKPQEKPLAFQLYDTHKENENHEGHEGHEGHKEFEPLKETLENHYFENSGPSKTADPNRPLSTTPFYQGMSNGNRRFVFADFPALKIVDSVNMNDQNLLPAKGGEYLSALGQDLVAHVYDQFNAHPEQISRFGPNDLVGLNIELEEKASADALIKRISAWDKLQKLFISNAELSDSSIHTLGKLPSLRFLRLSNVELNDNVLAQTPIMTKVCEFERKGSSNVKPLIAKLELNQELAQLSLDHSKLDHEDVQRISSMKSLRVLSLKDTDIDDQDLAVLAGLSNLEKLYVSKNDLNSSAFRNLKTLTKLQELEVGDPGLAAKVGKIVARNINVR